MSIALPMFLLWVFLAYRQFERGNASAGIMLLIVGFAAAIYFLRARLSK